MELQMFEVAYTATAKCVVLVSAFTADEAKTLVRTAEAGDVAEDAVEYGRQVVSATATPATVPLFTKNDLSFLTNRDPGDESGGHLPGR
jgi:hypothetical protein